MPRKRSIQSIQRQQRQRKCAGYKRRRTSKITAPVQQVDVADQNYDTLNVKVHVPESAHTIEGIDEVEKIHQDETDTVPVQGPVQGSVQDINAVEEIHVADQNYDTLNVKVHVPESARTIGFRFDKKKGTTGNIWLAGIVPGTPADKITNWSETIMYAKVLKYNNEDITCIDDILRISRQILDSKPITFDIEFRIVKKGLIPSLCEFIERKKTLQTALKYLTRTKIEGTTNEHQACVCVVCDSFIIGTEKICYLTEDQLVDKSSYLDVNYLETMTNKKLPPLLRNQYKLENCERLSSLLLSPRAPKKDNNYMSCETCYSNIL